MENTVNKHLIFGLLLLAFMLAGCTGDTPAQVTSGQGGSATKTTSTPPPPNYGELYDADDLFPAGAAYNWKDVAQDLAKVQSIIGTDAEVVSHASRDFEINGVKGNLLVVEGKTGEDAEKAVSGYLTGASSWISFYEIREDVTIGEGIEARNLLTLKDNGGTCTLLWNGHAYAFFVYLSSYDVNPYETGKQISEEILLNNPFLYEEAVVSETPPPEPTLKPATTTKEPVSFDAIAVGGWSGSGTCGGMSIIDGYFICPGGKIRGGQTLNNLGFSIKGTWDTGEEEYGDGKIYDTITVDYTYTAQADRSVTGKLEETWVYLEKSDALQLVGSCQLYLQRVEGEVDMSDCESSTITTAGGGQCTSDYQCGRCWYCDDGTCRYGGQGASGCYRGYSDGYIKLENQWFPIS
ncbi:hypothetical protein KKA03_06645 [archaeon]|nr:hypothetical protein [archaeon]